MTKRAWLSLLVALVSTSSGIFVACSGTTKQEGGLELLIGTNLAPSELDAIGLKIVQETDGPDGGQGQTLYDNEAIAVPGETTLPTTFSIAAGAGPDQVAHIYLTAYLNTKPVVLREVVVQVPTDRVAQLELILAQSCYGQVNVVNGQAQPACSAGESCQPATGACGSSIVDPSTLPPYVPGAQPDAAVGDFDATIADAGAPDVAPIDVTVADTNAPDVVDAGPDTTDATDAADSGPPCVPACATGATQCLTSASLETCALVSGCPAWSAAQSCGADGGATPGYVCERIGTAACADPIWAEWPMPSSPDDLDAGAPNPQSYTDNGDGTVTDNVTGLMWQQTLATADGGVFQWPDAVTYCTQLSLAGHQDWRLPSEIELVSIIDRTAGDGGSATINPTYFPGTPFAAFWASNLLASNNALAWIVGFVNGGTNGQPIANLPNNYARCVR